MHNEHYLLRTLGAARRVGADRERRCRSGRQPLVGVGQQDAIVDRFPESRVEACGESVIIPGLVNTHTHLELTALRGYLENEETDFFAWLRKLTIARLERMTF